MRQPTVAAIMTRRVVTVSMDDSLRRVRDIFDSERFHHLLVVEAGRVVGVLSDRDLLKHLSPFVGKINERQQDVGTLDRRVHQVMSRPLVSGTADMTLGEAGGLMLARGVSCLPILGEAGRCQGIVTLRDLLRWALVESGTTDPVCPLPDAA